MKLCEYRERVRKQILQILRAGRKKADKDGLGELTGSEWDRLIDTVKDAETISGMIPPYTTDRFPFATMVRGMICTLIYAAVDDVEEPQIAKEVRCLFEEDYGIPR